jgi:branched-chain amino acid aminotransferase
MMAYWNRDHYHIFEAQAHFSRFIEGAARMGMQFPWSADQMLAGVESILALEPMGTQYIRPIAYRKNPELWITGNKNSLTDVCIFTVQVERDQDHLISCHLSPVERISSRSIPKQTKVSGAYVNSFYTRYEAEAQGFEDGVMLDRYGRLTEASAANVFLISRNRLRTPKLTDDIFPGITRLTILRIATQLGIDVEEAELYESDLSSITGAFLCSTLMEIRGIGRLGSIELKTEQDPIFGAIKAQFRHWTHQ